MKKPEKIKAERTIADLLLKSALKLEQDYSECHNEKQVKEMFMPSWEVLKEKAQWVLASPEIRPFIAKMLPFNLSGKYLSDLEGISYKGTLDDLDYYEDSLFPTTKILIGEGDGPTASMSNALAVIEIHNFVLSKLKPSIKVKLKLPKMIDDFPRRNRMDHWTGVEHDIFHAMQVVEKLGADPLLTDAVVLLSQAKDKVSDYLEKSDDCL